MKDKILVCIFVVFFVLLVDLIAWFLPTFFGEASAKKVEANSQKIEQSVKMY